MARAFNEDRVLELLVDRMEDHPELYLSGYCIENACLYVDTPEGSGPTWLAGASGLRGRR